MALPKVYRKFITRHPKIRRAWELTAEAGAEGPLDARTQRLVKLGISIGALREGAVHAGVRRARAQGISKEAIRQVVALSAGTVGFPAAAAVFSWVEETLA